MNKAVSSISHRDNNTQHRNKQSLKPFDGEALIRKGLLFIVIAYLLVALVIPLFFVVLKSLQKFDFHSDKITISMDAGQGFNNSKTLQDWINETNYQVNDGLRASEISSLSLSRIIPKSQRRDISQFQLTDLSASGGQIQTKHGRSQAGETLTIPRSEFGSVRIRPIMGYGLGNYGYYFANPNLRHSIFNSLWVALAVVAIVLPIAFLFAYGITRTRMRFRQGFRLIAMIPVLAPSLLPAIGLIYLFGKQGILMTMLLGTEIYGALGIIIASVFFTLPHAVIILLVALSAADQRLYDAANVLGAKPLRTFFTVTLPGAKYGLISAGFVVFTLVITDFGVPKVIGGSFDVLALDIYKQVVGQQNFQIGSVVSMVLLLPAVLAFVIDRHITKRQQSMFSAQAQPLVINSDKRRDRALFAFCALVSIYIIGIIVMCQAAALIKFWPYNLDIGLWHYQFNQVDGGGWSAFFNSIKLALLVATIATGAVFVSAYLVEKSRGDNLLRNIVKLMSMIPMAVPGMVLGLAYIFFFNQPDNPLHFLYGTLAILVINCSIHFYTVTYLTATTALKQLDKEFEAVTTSLQQPFWVTFFQVTMPMSATALAEIWLYLFVNAMTTVSAVVFLYSPDTALASIAVLNMDDAGDTAPAAAMALMIFYTNVGVRILVSVVMGFSLRLQRWRYH